MSPLDQRPFGWAFVLGSIGTAAIFIAPFALAALIDFHRRGATRLRAHRLAQKGAAREQHRQ